jgi:hypothetical protein
VKQEADELIQALEDLLSIVPDGATLRLCVGNQADDAPMPPEEFIAFARKLLVVARKIREKYE